MPYFYRVLQRDLILFRQFLERFAALKCSGSTNRLFVTAFGPNLCHLLRMNEISSCSINFYMHPLWCSVEHKIEVRGPNMTLALPYCPGTAFSGRVCAYVTIAIAAERHNIAFRAAMWLGVMQTVMIDWLRSNRTTCLAGFHSASD